MIDWKDEYMLGIPHIDEQHKKLFKIADDIYLLLKDELCIDKYDRIAALIKELKDYTVFHFKSEEEYMLSIGYKRYFSQKLEHDEFVDKINSYEYNLDDENHDKKLIEILEFVVKWISVHILEKDKLIVQNS